MAYGPEHGPPDLDATHAWAPLTGTAPPTLNDRAADPPVLPWTKVLAIDGWSDLAELLENSEPVTYGIGTVAYPNRMLDKTVVYRCEVRAANREDVREIKTAIVRGYGQSFSDLGVMTVTPYPSPGGVVWTLNGRVQQVRVDPAFSHFPKRRAPWRWGISISIKMHDPRFYQAGTAYLG